MSYTLASGNTMSQRRWFTGLILAVFVTLAALAQIRFAREKNTAEIVPISRGWNPDVEGYEEDVAESRPPVHPIAKNSEFPSRYCIDCHSGESARGGFNISMDSQLIDWEGAKNAARSGRMPPSGKPRPGPAELQALIEWLEKKVEDRELVRAYTRRLNRTEYNNSIRDLFGIALRPADDFPADDTSEGFDTIGAVLSISPLHIEKYLAAAEAIVDAVSADPFAWKRLLTPPQEDIIPYILRGTPPLRDNAVKGSQGAIDERAAAAAAELSRLISALQAFADRAYRRPIKHAELARFSRLIETATNRGETPEQGFKLALKAVLISPHFLFKVEHAPATTTDENPQSALFELASRLSYFLWSSIPDEELFRSAAYGTLGDPHILVSQILRMLHDPRSQSLAENFAGQWLQTRLLSNASAQFPKIDRQLLHDMSKETELFFDSIVRQDRSITELLTSPASFLNERLAKHYGIPGVRGEDFRPIDLAATGRMGVLMHASVLTVTSGPTRTSPVKRGKWILETILGLPVLAPPPGVDALAETEDGRPSTLREQLARHRSLAACSSCHAHLDPLGLGLENFDAVGAWRNEQDGMAIDASGVLPDGRKFNGPNELVSLLAARPDDFARCLAEKLLTYGLGQGMQAGRSAAIERIVRHSARNGYRFSSLIIAIARSVLFQRK